MSDLIWVTYKISGIEDLVTIEEAEYYRDNDLIVIPSDPVDSLTKDDVFGLGYDDRYGQ